MQALPGLSQGSTAIMSHPPLWFHFALWVLSGFFLELTVVGKPEETLPSLSLSGIARAFPTGLATVPLGLKLWLVLD